MLLRIPLLTKLILKKLSTPIRKLLHSTSKLTIKKLQLLQVLTKKKSIIITSTSIITNTLMNITMNTLMSINMNMLTDIITSISTNISMSIIMRTSKNQSRKYIRKQNLKLLQTKLKKLSTKPRETRCLWRRGLKKVRIKV